MNKHPLFFKATPYLLVAILSLFIKGVDAGEISLSGLIVTSENPSPIEKEAALEIQGYYQKLGLKNVAIVVENRKETIPAGSLYIGETSFAKKQLKTPPLKAEEWLIDAVNGNLVLRGGAPRGILYSAYHFLEDVIGIHWWSPWGEEFIPKTIPSIASTLSLKGVPALSYREVYCAMGDSPTRRDFINRNRMNGDNTRDNYLKGKEDGWSESFGLPRYNHTFGDYIPLADYYETHPEFFAVNESGKRSKTSNQLSYTAPGLVAVMVEKLNAYIEESEKKAKAAGVAAPRYYDLSQNDIPGIYCRSEESMKWVKEEGSIAAPLIQFVNEIAREIKKTHPDIMLSTLAYMETMPPPKNLKVEDNVVIRLCSYNSNVGKPIDSPDNINFSNYLKGWRKLAKHVWLYHYTVSFNQTTSAHNYCTMLLSTDLQFCRKNGVEGIFIEHEKMAFNNCLWVLDHWMTLKLMEDPNQSYDLLLKTFCDGYYGAASPYVIEFVKKIKEASLTNRDYTGINAAISDFSYLNADFVKQAQILWEKAEAATAVDSIENKRVKVDRFYSDRVLLGVSQKIADEVFATKKETPAFEFSYAKTSKRMIDFLNKIPMELFPEPYFSKDKIPKEIENLNLYASVPWVESTPLPEKVLKNKSIPHQIIYPGTYRLESRQNKLVIDPQLNTRIAVCIDCKVKTATDSEAVVDTDISGRVYDMEAMKLYFKLDVPYDLMSEEKYQWIYLGAGEIRRTDFLYLQKDWGLQVTLGTFFNLSPEKKCTIWGEFKKQEKEKLIFLNRMALVKVVDVVSTPTTK